MSESSKTKTKAKTKAKRKELETKGQDGQLSCLNAAAKVLAEKGAPMTRCSRPPRLQRASAARCARSSAGPPSAKWITTWSAHAPPPGKAASI